MRFKVSTISLLSCLLLAFSGSAYAGGGKKGKDSKAAKECTDKGGTWDKKTKKCDTSAAAKDDAAPTTDGATPTTPDADKTPSDAPAPE